MSEQHPTKRKHFLGVRIAVPLLHALEYAADEERKGEPKRPSDLDDQETLQLRRVR
jgi:hypothetical protein